MPVDKDGVSVAFHTTLLALIRTSLDIYISGNMFDNDKELRRIMESIWPKDSRMNLSKLLPKVKCKILTFFNIFLLLSFHFKVNFKYSSIHSQKLVFDML